MCEYCGYGRFWIGRSVRSASAGGSGGGRGEHMSLSCWCGDGSDSEWFFYEPDEGKEFASLKASRAKRCGCCKALIKVGKECMTFACFRFPRCDYEEGRWGEDGEIPMADKHLCGECGEIYLNLRVLGYCVSIDKSLKEDLAEYWDLTGFDPTRYAHT